MNIEQAILDYIGKVNGLLIGVCCVCGKRLDTKSSCGAPGGVSHGFCDPCMRFYFEEV